MRLVHFSTDGADRRVGIERSGTVHDVSESMGRFDDALAAAAEGTDFGNSGETYDTDGVRLLPPTTARNTTFAVALNYYSHIEEVDQTGTEFERPRSSRSLIGPSSATMNRSSTIRGSRPISTTKANWRQSSGNQAATSTSRTPSTTSQDIPCLTILLHVTCRTFVRRMPSGSTGSPRRPSSSTPVGPAVVTADEVGDPSDLHIETRHNGDVVQDEGTHLMIYDVADLVSFVSTRVRLQPGDIVATGTPKGSGTSRTSPLADGDEVTVTIEGVGTLTNVVDRVQ